jgi:hypothetical protein
VPLLRGVGGASTVACAQKSNPGGMSMRPTVVVHQKPNPCHFVREGHMSLKSHTVTLMSIFPLLQHYVSIYQILNGLKSIKFDAKFAAENTFYVKNARCQQQQHQAPG